MIVVDRAMLELLSTYCRLSTICRPTVDFDCQPVDPGLKTVHVVTGLAGLARRARVRLRPAPLLILAA